MNLLNLVPKQTTQLKTSKPNLTTETVFSVPLLQGTPSFRRRDRTLVADDFSGIFLSHFRVLGFVLGRSE